MRGGGDLRGGLDYEVIQWFLFLWGMVRVVWFGDDVMM